MEGRKLRVGHNNVVSRGLPRLNNALNDIRGIGYVLDDFRRRGGNGKTIENICLNGPQDFSGKIFGNKTPLDILARHHLAHI